MFVLGAIYSPKGRNLSMALIFYIAVILTVLTLILTFTLFSFAHYHFKLAISNETTNEQIRKKYKKWTKNPFNMGKSDNWKYFNAKRVPIQRETAPVD